jgi:hypothetical protein
MLKMLRDDFTVEDKEQFAKAIKVWIDNKSDMMYWMEHHAQESINKWIERHGVEGCSEPGYVTYMIDEFCKWIMDNIM